VFAAFAPGYRDHMVRFGYALSGEEFPPAELVRNACRAEEAGFDFLMVSDHFHPWTDRQGNSPFVWSVLGAIAQTTERVAVGTGVTCPTIRIHPAIIAQAAATTAALMPGRFWLGVGTGEALNEHVLGDPWPAAGVRREMLSEAVEVIRKLWRGEVTYHRGRYYTVEGARIYSLPEVLPPIYVAASGPKATELAGRIGDGLVSLSPQAESIEQFQSAGGAGKPRVGQVEVCFAADEDEAVRTAYEWWPQTALAGELTQVLPMPAHFEQAVATVRPEDVAEKVTCGPDVDAHVQSLQRFVDAGYDHVYVHQVGPEQEAFLAFYGEEVLPRLRTAVPA
jgi:coenzyme F420-dependent glucose-6-phosphate dehydrogenase